MEGNDKNTNTKTGQKEEFDRWGNVATESFGDKKVEKMRKDEVQDFYILGRNSPFLSVCSVSAGAPSDLLD